MTNSRKKVLVIDDEEDFCFFVRENLANTGRFEVVIATKGLRGIELAEVEAPDIILLDMVMPDMGGEEILEKLRENRRTAEIPVVFLTALATRQDTGSEVFKKIGDSYFVAKPVRTRELIRAIDYFLGANA
ncbi:MAG: response regulator [Desulfobacterales bacterium]|nr:response regulator [Desulfobacterales bacterium]MBS3754640.1 response regulator [Desulfobacterales bacterium]